MKKSKEIEVQPFTLKHQYASSPYCSQYISYGAHKDNLSNNQERLLRQIQGQRFTCRLGFSPRARTYILNFRAKKNRMLFNLSSFYRFFVKFRLLSLSKPSETVANTLL